MGQLVPLYGSSYYVFVQVMAGIFQSTVGRRTAR
jgi:hypothetical protein